MPAHPTFDLDWNLVRTFVAVARSGSLASGARKLGITHPTAARHVQMLEETVGVSLFTRTAQGLLNEAGELLQTTAHTMHESALAFSAATDGIRARPVSRVRISVAEILAELLPDIMATDWQAESSQAIAVDMIVTNDLLNLLHRDADIALRHVRPEQQELISRRLGSVRMGLFAHRSYVDRWGRLEAEEVVDHSFVDGLNRDYLVRGARSRGMSIEPHQITFRSDSVACQRAAVSAGWGVAAFPLWMAANEPDWVVVSPQDQVIDLEVWLVARPEVRECQQLYDIFRSLGAEVAAQLVRSV